MWGGNDWTRKPVWLLYKPIIINVIQIIIQHALSIIIKIWAKALCVCGLRSLKWNSWNECLFSHFWREEKSIKCCIGECHPCLLFLGYTFKSEIFTQTTCTVLLERWSGGGWVGRDLKQIFDWIWCVCVCVCTCAHVCVCVQVPVSVCVYWLKAHIWYILNQC